MESMLHSLPKPSGSCDDGLTIAELYWRKTWYWLWKRSKESEGKSLLVFLLALPLNAIAYSTRHENIAAQHKTNWHCRASKAPAIVAPTMTSSRAAACKPETTTTPTTTAKALPMPSCYVQNEDSYKGINARGCICGTVTLPLLTLPEASIVNDD